MREKQPEVTEEQKESDGYDAAMLQSLLCKPWSNVPSSNQPVPQDCECL